MRSASCLCECLTPPKMADTGCYVFVAILWTLFMGTISDETSIKGPFDICERDTFNASCSQGEVIMMHYAMYGRMSLGTCIRQQTTTRNCDKDVLTIMDGFCSGLPSCNMRVRSLLDVKQCPEHVAFLRASYMCIKAASSHSHCGSSTAITAPSGYLPSSQRLDTGAGTSYCPWTLNANSNQRFNFTLYKFVPFNESPLSSSTSVCFEVGTITEGGVSQGVLSCGSDPRQKVIYLSKGGDVRIHFKDNSFLRDLGTFMLHYEEIGCEDPPLPKHSSLKRSGNDAVITCDAMETSWHVTCQNGRWEGEVGQCSQEKKSDLMSWLKSNTEYSIGLLCIVTLGCAAVIFCGGFCLYVSYFYLTKQNRTREEPTYTIDNYKLQTLQRAKYPPMATYERTTSLRNSHGTLGRNSDYQRMNPVDPETVSHHSYVLYDHVPKPLPPIPIDEKRHIYETPLPVDREY